MKVQTKIKYRTFMLLAVMLTALGTPRLFSQPGDSSPQLTAMEENNGVKEEKDKFLHQLRSGTTDREMINTLAGHFDDEVSRIHKSLNRTKGRSLDKEKAVRSLVFFIRELNERLLQRKLDVYGIGGALEAYENVIRAVIAKKQLVPVLANVGVTRSEIVSKAFSQYAEYALLQDIVVFKRMASTPEYIIQFLQSNPRFRFADSLLLEAVAYDPLKVFYFLRRNDPVIKKLVSTTDNTVLKQIEILSNDKYASEVLPFVLQVAEQKMTTEEILEQRASVNDYFKLMVNTLHQTLGWGDPNSIHLKPLRVGIKQKALSFYVNSVNDLHNASDPVRFASVNELRPQDIYYVITSCGDELYTSSYLGLYKRLMKFFDKSPADSLFDIVQYDNLRTFLRLAANYNVLKDFMKRLSSDRMRQVIQRYVSGIENDDGTALEKAMDVADSFNSLDSTSDMGDIMAEELRVNLNRSKSSRDFRGLRLYSILSDMLGMVRESGGLKKMWTLLGDYEQLKRQSLENWKGEVIELVLFYGDEDGIVSFNNFLKHYADAGKWEITRNNQWVSIRSRAEKPVIIFANRPLDIQEELDLAAQDSLVAYLEQNSIEPTVLVHRGHSYHLDKTLRKITPSVKLAILGSCGGYNRAISIANINNEVQVIGSKKIGSMSVNDPFLEEINDLLANQQDLLWPQVWKTLRARFSRNEAALNQFNEYFPPSENLGLFVLKLYNYYNRIL